MCPTEVVTAISIEPESFVPKSDLSKAAFEHASMLLHPAILNHSIRVFLYARALAEASKSAYHNRSDKQDLLFVACIFHDIGTSAAYNGPHRFEVEGADAACKHLAKFGVGDVEKDEVWKAIALHTCNGIVQRMGELCALVRAAIEMDFGKSNVSAMDAIALREHFEKRYVRRDIEKTLCDLVVAQAVEQPSKAPPASWPGVLYEWHLEHPDWQGTNGAFGP